VINYNLYKSLYQYCCDVTELRLNRRVRKCKEMEHEDCQHRSWVASSGSYLIRELIKFTLLWII